MTADAVYANYGRPEDFKRLDDLHVSVAGKIVIARYGMNFRGVKVYMAQQRAQPGSSSIPILRTMATSRVTNIPTAHGARIPGCSAARWNTCSSIRATRPRRVLRLPRVCPHHGGCLRQRKQPADHPLDAAFLQGCGADPRESGRPGRAAGSGRAPCRSATTLAGQARSKCICGSRWTMRNARCGT